MAFQRIFTRSLSLQPQPTMRWETPCPVRWTKFEHLARQLVGGFKLGTYPPNTVDGRNPANQLRLVVYPMIYHRWLFWISSIKSRGENRSLFATTSFFSAKIVSNQKKGLTLEAFNNQVLGWDLRGWWSSHGLDISTLPETNIALEDRPLEVWRFVLKTIIFRGELLVSGYIFVGQATPTPTGGNPNRSFSGHLKPGPRT